MSKDPSQNKAFVTTRTQRWRDTELDAASKRTVGHIEEYGCSIVSVAKTGFGLGWSYTIGVFDTCGGAELITVGLPPETAHYALNEAAALLRRGVNLTAARHRDLVGEVECEFRPVDPKWVRHLMGWAVWYYGGADFPVLQAVYPDLENRFPEDDAFDERFDQPRMQPSAPMRTIENDFWAAADPSSSLFNWKFPDPPHSRVFLSETVQKGIEPVTYVSHDADDGAWQFLGDSMSEGGGPVISCFHHPIDRDPTLAELADLPLGWHAERAAVGAPWMRSRNPDTEESE